MKLPSANRPGLRNDHGAQMVEFAVALPLLVVFVVGIFDFSGAFTLKQKLTNAARDAARVAAADPATDLGNGTTPASVADAYQSIDKFLTVNNLNECGITQSSLSQSGSTLTWSATASGGSCPPTAGLASVSINRGYATSQTVGGTATKIIATQVTLQYAYDWRFNRVISLLVSGTTYSSVTTLTASATALNEN